VGALRGPATEAVDRTWRNDVTIGAAGFVTEAVIFGVLYSFGVVLEPIRIDLRASTSTVALIPTVAAFTLFFVGPVTGRLADLYGTHVTVAAGGVAMAVGLALTSLARSVWPAVVGFGVLGGLSAGLGYIPVVAQMAALPTRRAPALVGFAVAGVGAGTALAAPLLDWAVGTYGWRATYQVYGAGAVVVLGLTAWAFGRQPSIRSSRQLSVVAAIRPLLGRSDFRRLYLSLLLVCPSIYVGLIFLPSYITKQGLSSGQAAAAAAVLGICSGGGRIVLSALGGRIEPATMYRLSLGLLAASLALWLVAGSNYVALLGYAVMAGTGYGGVVGLAPTVTASRHGREGLGTILGGLYTALGAGALITGPAAGAIIDAAGYRPAFISVGLLAAAAALIVPSGPAARQH
jgi:MFS family permease